MPRLVLEIATFVLKNTPQRVLGRKKGPRQRFHPASDRTKAGLSCLSNAKDDIFSAAHARPRWPLARLQRVSYPMSLSEDVSFSHLGGFLRIRDKRRVSRATSHAPWAVLVFGFRTFEESFGFYSLAICSGLFSLPASSWT